MKKPTKKQQIEQLTLDVARLRTALYDVGKLVKYSLAHPAMDERSRDLERMVKIIGDALAR